MEKDPTFRNNSLEAAQYIEDMARHLEFSKNVTPYRIDESIPEDSVELAAVKSIRKRSESHNTILPPAFQPDQVTACYRIDNPEIFFNEANVVEAKKVCEVCLVTLDCLAYAIKYKTKGIWGGTTEDKRKNMKIKPRYN